MLFFSAAKPLIWSCFVYLVKNALPHHNVSKFGLLCERHNAPFDRNYIASAIFLPIAIATSIATSFRSFWLVLRSKMRGAFGAQVGGHVGSPIRLKKNNQQGNSNWAFFLHVSGFGERQNSKRTIVAKSRTSSKHIRKKKNDIKLFLVGIYDMGLRPSGLSRVYTPLDAQMWPFKALLRFLTVC